MMTFREWFAIPKDVRKSKELKKERRRFWFDKIGWWTVLLAAAVIMLVLSLL